MLISRRDKILLAALEDGLPLVRRPYAAVAEQLGWCEEQVIERIGRLVEAGVIRRHGVIVSHHKLGFTSNGMAVWDIEDDKVESLATRLAAFPWVTLCYQRPRRLPDWPYNLFCMVHGRDRGTILGQVRQMIEKIGLEDRPHDVLFSSRQFKQRGAKYSLEQAPQREKVA